MSTSSARAPRDVALAEVTRCSPCLAVQSWSLALSRSWRELPNLGALERNRLHIERKGSARAYNADRNALCAESAHPCAPTLVREPVIWILASLLKSGGARRPIPFASAEEVVKLLHALPGAQSNAIRVLCARRSLALYVKRVSLKRSQIG